VLSLLQWPIQHGWKLNQPLTQADSTKMYEISFRITAFNDVKEWASSGRFRVLQACNCRFRLLQVCNVYKPMGILGAGISPSQPTLKYVCN